MGSVGAALALQTSPYWFLLPPVSVRAAAVVPLSISMPELTTRCPAARHGRTAPRERRRELRTGQQRSRRSGFARLARCRRCSCGGRPSKGLAPLELDRAL